MDDSKEEDNFYSPSLKTSKKQEILKIEEKQKLLDSSEISIILDNYNDMFSSFDPRAYSERALSDDFLPEIKRAAKDRPSGQIELRLLIPKDKRDSSTESLIKKRLKDHFKKHKEMLNRELTSTKFKGMRLILFGAILGLLATLISSYNEENLFIKFISILLEPASWFTIWNGFDYIFFISMTKNPDIEFYEKMSKAEVQFLSY